MHDGRVQLLCTVHGCARELFRSGKDLVCANGHNFNVARSGYVNLLQPQERHSKHPGDSKEAVAARRRLQDGGNSAPLLDALCTMIAKLELPRGACVLDVGCGEGTFLASIQKRFEMEAWGIDISTPAIEAASRRYADAHWIVANADRMLPFPARSFALILSITGRRNARELARLLAVEASVQSMPGGSPVPEGRVLFALPAADDQCELRTAVMGRATSEDRLAKLVEELAGQLTLECREEVRWTARYDADGLSDLLATTYRGARKREQERFAAIDALDVTSSYSIGCFRSA